MRWDIAKWDPFRDMVSLRDEVDKVFKDFFGRLPAERRLAEGYWFPTVDLEESPDEVAITAEIPGMRKEDIHISISGDQLSITGERRKEEEEKGKTYHRIERSYGRFQRTVALPTEVLSDKARASYKDGLLKITLPKAEKVKPKEIAIEVK